MYFIMRRTADNNWKVHDGDTGAVIAYTQLPKARAAMGQLLMKDLRDNGTAFTASDIRICIWSIADHDGQVPDVGTEYTESEVCSVSPILELVSALAAYGSEVHDPRFRFIQDQADRLCLLRSLYADIVPLHEEPNSDGNYVIPAASTAQLKILATEMGFAARVEPTHEAEEAVPETEEGGEATEAGAICKAAG